VTTAVQKADSHFSMQTSPPKLPNSISMQYAEVFKDRGYKDRGANLYINIIAKS
jgi:hypothetical protein